MFHFPSGLKLLVAVVLTCALPIEAARAEHFRFTVLFNDGPLSGSFYVGYFKTSKAAGAFYPDGHGSGQLLSLAITIDGAKFVMQDDKDFPSMPRVEVQNTGSTRTFDYDASKGSAAALHDKWMWMYRSIPDKVNDVKFGTLRGNERIVESAGVLNNIVQINEREAPPEPDCSAACHSMPRR